MKITVLVENSAVDPLKAEHGLSFLIEYDGEQYLLDAGSTDLFLENASMLGAPVWDVKTCFLSHGHYDHSGGFYEYLSRNQDAQLYMMKDATADYYSGSGELHFIGIPEAVIQKHEERFCYIETVTEVREGIHLVPHCTEKLEKIGERAKLYRRVGENLVPDNFSHEMSLVFDTEKGLVVFNSCSHGGALNIIREVLNTFPEKNIYAFVGGLHMKGKQNGVDICIFSEEEIIELSDEIKKTGLQYLYTGHCTGKPAMELLGKYMGEQLKALYTGLVLEI